MSATISSIFLVCQDLQASRAFYGRLGFELIKSAGRTAVFSLGAASAPELHLHEQLSELEQQEYGVSWQPGTTGMVISFATEDLEALVALASPEALIVPPRPTPWGSRMAMLIDPDGYRLEFSSRRELAS